MTTQDPTAARNAYLAQVIATPPAPRQPCAAGCGQPLTQWHVDAQGRHWHPDCLPVGTPMPVPAGERVRHLEAQLDRVRAECHLIAAEVYGQHDEEDDGRREAVRRILTITGDGLEARARTTPDNPPTSSKTVDNPGQPPGGCTQAEGFCDEHGFHRHPPLDEGGQHEYLSTGCLHGEHGYCQSNTGAAGTKIPAVCKFCQAPCLCGCHRPAKP